MNAIVVKAEHEYQVSFSKNVFEKIASDYSDREIVLIAPESLLKLMQEVPKEWHLIRTLDGEEQKTGESYLSVLEQIAELNLSRKALLVGFGGGATTDLTGFVAATYLRGIDWIAAPTSLAGMVDAAVGGKTGINLGAGKNLAGAFHSPLEVIIAVDLLATLPERDLFAGMAEVAKCGFIADERILELIETDWRGNLPELIHRSVTVKAKVVSDDFKESYLREILNYGHTLGHAIEKHSNYSLRHGEAVATGMIFAAELSHHFSGLDKEVTARHYRVLKSLNLPITYARDAWKQLLELMQHDKKKNERGLRFVTLSKIGEPVRCENPSEQVMQEIYLSKIGV